MFTKFERLDVEKNSTTEGIGLGLVITKSLVEMMGGKIDVQSEFGKGTLFVAQIPQKISMMSDPDQTIELTISPNQLKIEEERLYKKQQEQTNKVFQDDNEPEIL